MRLDESRYATPAQVSAFYREALARVRVLPGVSAAAMVTGMPYSRNAVNLPLAIEGQSPEKGTPPAVMVQSVSGDYFRALNVPLRAGRFLGDMDGPEQPRVAVVSERLARRFFAGRSPIGERIRVGPNGPWLTIAGVTGDIAQSVMDREPQATVYLPYLQAPVREMNLGLRVSSGGPLALASAVTAAVRSIDPEQPIEN
ncbi:MAG TPA: ABC transporter permease, partial [Bryobacteraceae bacterium]|nr:ABC transporter permease [Bryobacteraceae bacterium]